MRRFELVEGTSSKFWQVSVKGADLITQWGRIGTEGQVKTKTCASASAAETEMRKLIDQKTRKGYGEVTAAGAPTAPTASAAAAATPPAKAAPTAPARTATPADAAPAAAPAPQPTTASASEPDSAASPAAGTPPWLAGGDPVRLDQALLELAFATRAHHGPVPPPAEWNSSAFPEADQVLADLTTSPPELHHLTEAAVAVTDSANLTRDQAIALLLIETTRWTARASLGTVAARFGLLEAIRLLLESYRYGIRLDHTYRGPTHVAVVTDPQPYTGTDSSPLKVNEQRLRHLLAAASEEEYAAAVEVITEAWPTLEPYRRAGLALALPDRPEFTDELITTFAAERPSWLHWLQATASTPELAAVAARVRSEDYHSVGSTRGLVNALVAHRGSGAVAYLAPYAELEQTGEALTRIGTPEAIRALVAVAQTSKTALANFRAAVDAWPVAAAAGLAETASGDGRAATLARSTLSDLVRQRPEVVAQVTGWVSAPAAAVLADLAGRASQVLDEAGAAELPAVLSTPPWLQKRAKDTPVAVEPFPLPPVENWVNGRPDPADWKERDTVTDLAGAARAVCWVPYSWNAKNTTEQECAAVATALGTGDLAAVVASYRTWVAALRVVSKYTTEAVSAVRILHTSRAVLDEVRPGFALEVWNTLAGTAAEDRELGFAVAAHGTDALPGLCKVVQRRPSEAIDTALPIGAIELAPIMARAFHKLKSVRDSAFAWLATHPEHAAAGLIAPAIGGPGEAGDSARAALQRLAIVEDGRYRPVIMDMAARYGRDDVTAAVARILDQDPNDRYPTKVPKLPSWWAPDQWHRPVLTSGRALPIAAVNQFGTMLMFPIPDGEVYPGIGQVIEACDRDSLAAFGWDLFAAWLAVGGPSKDGWAMTSLGLLGNDDTARRITPYLRAWPGEAQHKRAVNGLAVLEGIGTDLALMQLNGIATKIKFKGLQDEARVKIAAIAENRGLTTEELEDRLAPDLGLDANATTTLDFGPRRFTVGFDEALRPYVRDADGVRLKDLPKPRQTDDAALASAATERWKTLKKDARAVASQQVLRLEVAMCVQRRWPLETFETFLAGHPLVRHLVQRLLWATYDVTADGHGAGEPVQYFRVDESGGYTDADDEPVTLPGTATIGIPHALEIPAEVAAGFGQLFADYELLQPFDQLARESYRLTEDEMAATKLTRWAAVQVPTGKVLGLTNHGWRRGIPADGGVAGYIERQLGEVSLIASLDPGLFTGYLDEAPEQAIVDVQVGTTNGWGDVKDPQPFASLSPIAISELIRDLDGLRG